MKQELREGIIPEESKNIVQNKRIVNRARAEADGNSFKRGNVYAMLYCGDRPLIVIGPHCKSVIIEKGLTSSAYFYLSRQSLSRFLFLPGITKLQP